MKKFFIKMLIVMFMFFPTTVLAYSQYIIPGGENIGIEVHNNGVMVVGFYKVNGNYINTSLQAGDNIIKVGNMQISSINDLISAIDNYMNSEKVDIVYLRDDTEFDGELTAKLFDGVYKTGLYVKDSLNGTGTISYIDKDTMIYGALGHEIIESNTNKKIEVKTGNIFDSYVIKIDKSMDGMPGSKRAKINYDKVLGTITKNTSYGIFGIYESDIPKKEELKVGTLDDVYIGKATIYTVVNGSDYKEYEIDITKIDKDSETKNFYFKITDEELLDKTGGVVQGMSGSPIIQDDKIIGAVTHVIVDDVKTGYGISIVTMLEEGEK